MTIIASFVSFVLLLALSAEINAEKDVAEPLNLLSSHIFVDFSGLARG